MIEVKVDKESKRMGYPMLMSSTKGSGLVVLFTSKDVGTVIDPGSSGHNVGCHRDYWSDDFTPLSTDELIVLRNKK